MVIVALVWMQFTIVPCSPHFLNSRVRSASMLCFGLFVGQPDRAVFLVVVVVAIFLKRHLLAAFGVVSVGSLGYNHTVDVECAVCITQ